MAKYDFDDEDGVWRTVGGRRIFIREGQSLGDAMKSSGKFKSAKRNIKGPKSKEIKEINKKIDEEFGTEEKAKQYEQDKGLRDLIKDKDALNERLLEMKKSGEYKELLGDNDEKSMKEAEDRIRQQKETNDSFAKKEISNKTYKSSELEKGKPYNIDMGNGIEKTAIYIGKDENGNNSFYDGEGVSGTFGFSDKFVNERLKISDGKDDDKFIKLHNQIKNETSNKTSKADNVAERLGLKKGDSYVNKEGTKVDILEKDDKGQTLHKFTTSDDKTDYKNYNEKDVESMLKHNGYEKQSNNSKYNDYYKKEHLGTPSNYQKGDKIEFSDGYYNTIKGSIVREATDNEKRYQINSNLKGYIVRDENGFEHVVADTRIKEIGGTNKAYRSAYEDYKKKHPNTKLTFNQFVDMSEGK